MKHDGIYDIQPLEYVAQNSNQNFFNLSLKCKKVYFCASATYLVLITSSEPISAFSLYVFWSMDFVCYLSSTSSTAAMKSRKC